MHRKHIVIVFGLLSLLFFILIGLTAPAIGYVAANKSLLESQKMSKTVPDTSRVAPKSLAATRVVTETKVIPYETVTQDDSSLPKGQTRINREGVDGIESFIYTVTFTGDKESGRALTSRSVTTPAVSKIVAVGTSVLGTGYTNSDGNHINSPSSSPEGATAQCIDGTYSYSAHRQGTCSHHGGVARWL